MMFSKQNMGSNSIEQHEQMLNPSKYTNTTIIYVLIMVGGWCSTALAMDLRP